MTQQFMVGATYESEGLRQYRVVSFHTEFRYPYIARRVGQTSFFGKPVEFDAWGTSKCGRIKLTKRL